MNKNKMFWDSARCPKNKWHAYTDLFEDSGGKVEVCIWCGTKAIYRKNNGKIDNRAYLKDHVRDFCQPTGPTADVFEEIYGKTAIKNLEEEAKKQGIKTYRKSKRGQSEQQQNALDYFRTLGKSSV